MNETHIRRVLALLQIQFWEKGNRLSMCCPFHHDRDPSAAFYLDTGYFHCYADGIHTDLTGFYARARGTSREQAARDLEKTIGLERDQAAQADQRKLGRARGAGEQRLRQLRHLPRRTHAKLGEDLDRILLAYERGQIDNARLDKLLRKWYNNHEERTADGPPDRPRATDARPHDRVEKGIRDLPEPRRPTDGRALAEEQTEDAPLLD